ncbi:metallophosphoesterase [Rossellomorea sp. KS-H15a]|uniref:metallophosphoesterase family protein n=1 Tax=Rossellomorea sp. KS-H15a TaxID=2963940 RepID=UPI0020C73CAE|nr:metallophosphoesterase [Rossellomorea sp. KS-H15a]UTE77673.1 metallophosphoesterase [Rossellomorea sp. KS-H15a]
MKNWLKKGFVLMLIFSLFPLSVQALDNPFSSAGERDGGIGNTTHYVDEFPNISLDQKVNQIIYPLFATPAIKKKGESLTIQVDTQGKETGSWSVKLKQTNHSSLTSDYELPVKSVQPGKSHWKDSSSIVDVTVSIPEGTPQRLYDLEVTYTGNGKRITDEQPHSVKVVDEYKKNFSFLHLTDTHIGSPRNLGNTDDPSSFTPGRAKETGMWDPDPTKRWLYLQKAIKEVNLKNPDFVVITGDLMFGQLNPLEYIYEYEETYKMLQKLNVPVYIVPGNHDYYAQDATLTDGAKYWEKYFGPQYFSFDYGPYAHFIGYNSFDWNKFDRSGTGTVSVPTWGGQIREEQLNWVKQDLQENAKTAQSDQIRGLFSHHNPLWRDRDIWPQDDPDVQEYWKQYDEQHDPQRLSTLILGEKLGIKYDQQWHGENAKELIDIMKANDVTISLHGHTHIDDVTKEDGILYTTTTAIELSGKPWVGFRDFSVQNGQISSYNYEEPDRSIPVYQNGDTEGGTMSFDADYLNENDGSAASQRVDITNRLNKPLKVTIPLYMAEGNYTVSKGSITQNYASDGKQYLEVQITIPANSTEIMNVQKK